MPNEPAQRTPAGLSGSHTRQTPIAVLLLLIALLVTACGRDGEPETVEAAADTPAAAEQQAEPDAPAGVRADGTFRIVATTTQASDLSRILAADVPNIEITPLMGAGVDPHLYQPTESDIRAMNAADMVVYSGLHLEGQFDAVFEALREQGTLIYSLSKPVKDGGFVIGGFGADETQAGTDDPHFWFDPRNWEITVSDLAQTLAELDPDNGDTYTARADAYNEQLRLLFSWADEGMRSVPEAQRYLVTSHDAFQYFGAAFGWQMAGIQGISTEDETGVGDIQRTAQFVVEQEIPVLFVESSISPDTIEAVQAAIEARGGGARVGVRELYSDAMGMPGTFGGTYIGMIAENVYTILQSYRCAGAPAVIPDWPDAIDVAPPQELLTVSCDSEE
ncbi:MAG: manganese transporter [Caldilineaceae bacterium SB0670_bin_27]|uniref:Manganese transporter n=1 Tax=Caldilineaceae bacterium SB0664_bin_27 TaxID=2605260 RepID=A0A6B0YPC0_9CHLR|nr:manganese transporter [Caldilineaceae bacterium SB0664_bin_27]MYJ78738.1 manganese transporter [Caldilineaceae bacterium SB0670_bin_27]